MGDLGSILESGRSPGEGNGNQCSCLENPRDRGDWWAAVYGVAQSWTQLKRLSSSSSSSLISFQSKGHSRVFSHTTVEKYQFLGTQLSLVQLSHHYMTAGKTIALTAAAAAKSFQSCPTLCDPTDGSPPGSPIPEILQARPLEWVAISFSNAWKWKVKVKSLSRVRLLATPWTAAHQAFPSIGFSRQGYWSGVQLASPEWTWVWVKSGSWWWTWSPGMLKSMESQRVRHGLAMN